MLWVTTKGHLIFVSLLTGCSKWSFVKSSQSSQPLLKHFQDVAACAAERMFWLRSQASQNSNGKIEEIAIHQCRCEKLAFVIMHSQPMLIHLDRVVYNLSRGFLAPWEPSQGERNHSKLRSFGRCITTYVLVFTFHLVSHSSGTFSSWLFLSNRNPPFSAEGSSSWGRKNNIKSG